ncbi:MAG: hypothetical protein B7X99_16345, partial [Rhizobiales bacterium 17-65-6]
MGCARAPAPRTGGRHLAAAAVALALCVTIVALAIVADAEVARAAHGLPPAAVRVFDHITQIGKSGWIFALSAIVALSA